MPFIKQRKIRIPKIVRDVKNPPMFLDVEVDDNAFLELLKYQSKGRKQSIKKIVMLGGFITSQKQLLRHKIHRIPYEVIKKGEKVQEIVELLHLVPYGRFRWNIIYVYTDNQFLGELIRHTNPNRPNKNFSRAKLLQQVKTILTPTLSFTFLEELEHGYQNVFSPRYMIHHRQGNVLLLTIFGFILAMINRFLQNKTINIILLILTLFIVLYYLYYLFWPKSKERKRKDYENDIREKDAKENIKDPQLYKLAKKAFKPKFLINDSDLKEMIEAYFKQSKSHKKR